MQNNQNQNNSSDGGSAPMKAFNAREASNLQELSQSYYIQDSYGYSVLPGQKELSEYNRKRSYIGGGIMGQHHTISYPPSQQPGSNLQSNMAFNMQEASSNTAVIYGTNINTNELNNKLRNFIETFVDMGENDTDYTKTPYYMEQLKDISITQIYVLDVNCDHMFGFDPSLYKQLENYPSDVIPVFDLIVTAIFKEQVMMEDGMEQMSSAFITVRPFNIRNHKQIRELDPTHIEKLVSIKGIVIRNSDVIPEMKEASFKCFKCHFMKNVFIERGRIMEPESCENCQSKRSFQMIHNNCYFNDKQHVKIQETPESVPEGETPHTIHLCAYEDLVDYVKPGDRVEVIGIYKAVGVRTNTHSRTLKNVYRTYIDVINYVKTDSKRYTVDLKQDAFKDGGDVKMEQEEEGGEALVRDDHNNFSEYQKQQFHKFAQDPQLYDKLIDSFAPSIWENQDVKKGILCQLFGGCSKEFSQSGRGRFRGEINILLCGDPSTAKSQLLVYVHKIAPRGIYTSGKGSSAVGLTVYITKDPETREIILESGALVLSDRGICCIDEFDKMDDNTRVILHEAMEQQTVSVAKAGIICTLNARTAILAAANPVQSKYNAKLSVVDNIKLPPTLLSRFDLIYLILDKQSESHDRRLANHIVSLYSKPKESQFSMSKARPETQTTEMYRTNSITREFFANYISYARKNCNPTIPDYVVDDLVKEYAKMRNMGNSKKTITATPRQLESMIRIAESLARMRLSQTVEKQDVAEAVRLIKTAMQQSATDPLTGEIDMDIITTGISHASTEKVKQIVEVIKRIKEDFREKVKVQGVNFGALLDFVNKKYPETPFAQRNKHVQGSVTEAEVLDAIRLLEDENIVARFGHLKNPNIRFIEA